MPYFKWIGVDITGAIKKGKRAAYSRTELSQQLFQCGVALLHSKPLYTPAILWRLSQKDRAYFFDSVGRLLKAGVMIPDVFVIAAQQLDNPILCDAFMTCALAIKQGEPFATAIKKQNAITEPLVLTMLTVGHESGDITAAVENIAHYYHLSHLLTKKIRASLATPLMTSIFFVGISLFIFVFIMPRFAEMFISMNTQLPALTRCMITISNVMVHHFWFIVVISIVVSATIMGMLRSHRGYRLCTIVSMNMPFIGRFMRYRECGQLLYGLSLLIKSGSTVVQALGVLQASTHNHVIKQHILALQSDMQAGTQLSQAMFTSTLFSPDVVSLVHVGEESGTLSESLHAAADIYYHSMSILLDRMLFIMHPLLIILFGLLVGMLILAVYLPIMNLSYAL